MTVVSQRSPEIIVHRQAEETLEGKSQRSSLALNSGRTGGSLKRRLRRTLCTDYEGCKTGEGFSQARQYIVHYIIVIGC
jgi:hypothetical protein